MFILAAGAGIAILLMLLRWSLKTLLPRPAGLAVDRAFAAAGAVWQKMMAVLFLLMLAGLVFIMFVPAPH